MKLPKFAHLLDWTKKIAPSKDSSESYMMSIAQELLAKEEVDNNSYHDIYSDINESILFIYNEIAQVHQSIESNNRLIEKTIDELKFLRQDVHNIHK